MNITESENQLNAISAKNVNAQKDFIFSNRKKPYSSPLLTAPQDMVATTRYFLQIGESGGELRKESPGRQLEK